MKPMFVECIHIIEESLIIMYKYVSSRQFDIPYFTKITALMVAR